uniref:Small ribosomal subunit protein uS4c n=1 Tax=Aphanochaete confervicola TaxID=764104 RepID=A0A6H1XE09_9CHLO|nr:ribosomal protein S4 [Aphanochaete confervicola]QJA13853.1 ribosomal protein S4 [Aphanochaete confervicola]
MARYLGPRLRITRRLGHLSGLTRKKPSFKPLNPANPLGVRKIIPPGQHGRNKSFKKKPYESCEYDYLIRLKLKQRLRFHYGLTERQLVRYVQQAKKTKGSTGRVLLSLLEMRLDNIVFRLHMAPTIRAARQLISHGHILVNKTKVNIPSYQCEPKDVITVAPKIRSMELVSRFLTEFDREKSRYQRLLNILEYGKRGITTPTKDLYSTKKDLVKIEQSQRIESLKNSKIQSLKIGSVLNVQVKQQGRYEAEVISYAFGKMIVIHPLFLGKQSINKKIRVIIYKKSQNNKILYAYPANPFYLRLENMRQLNALDVARIFGRYTGRFVNRSGSQISTQKKTSEKKTLSSLILINGAKTLSKNVLKRRQRLNFAGKENVAISTDLNQEVSKKEFTSQALTSVFVRIIATKCLNNKLKSTTIGSGSNVAQSSVKDPVTYREKFVYTSTSRTLRQFGTRFYAQILKDQSLFKNVLPELQDDKSLNNQKVQRTTLAASENRMNLSKMSSLRSQNVSHLNKNEVSIELLHKSISSKAKSKQESISSTIQSNKFLEMPLNVMNEIHNDNSNVFKFGRGYPELFDLLSKQNKSIRGDFSRIGNIPVIFNQYVLLISKLANLKQQKNFKYEIYSKLKAKLLRNLLVEAKNQFLSQNTRSNFICIFFHKIMKVLDLKKTLEISKDFKQANLLLLSKNIEDLFFDKKFKSKNLTEESSNNILKKYSEKTVLFILNVKATLNQWIEGRKHSLNGSSEDTNLGLPTSLLTKYHLGLFQQKITNNLQLLSLLDQIKNNLQNDTNFTKNLFPSDIAAGNPSLDGATVDLLILKTNKWMTQIITDIISTLKSLPILSKLMLLKSKMTSSTEADFNVKYNKTLTLIEKKLQSLKFYKKVINSFMLSVPKSIYLSQYTSTLVKLETLHENNQITDIDYNKKHLELLNTLSVGFVNQQRIQQITILEFLTKYNIINSKLSINFSNVIKSNLISHKVHQRALKELAINKFQINKVNQKINVLKMQQQNIMLQQLIPAKTTPLVYKMEQDILEKQIGFSISLFSNVEKKLTNQKNVLVKKYNSSSEERFILNVLSERGIFVTKLKDLVVQKKVTQKLLNQKTKISTQLHLLKQFNLITSDNFEKLNCFLQTKFSLLENLVLLSLRPACQTNLAHLNKVIEKISNQIVQKLASYVSLWKIIILQKEKNLPTTEFVSLKQIIIENIINFKMQFTDKLITKLLHSQSPSLNSVVGLIKDGLSQQIRLSKPTNQLKLIRQIYNIYILDTLKNLNIIMDQSYTQIYSEIREKLSIKKLMQTNLVLIKFLQSLKTNGNIKVISLDNFVQTVVTFSSSKKMDLATKLQEGSDNALLKVSLPSKTKNIFWKQILLEFTPLRIKTALENLKGQNLFSFMPGSVINIELERLINLFNQNRIFNLSLNKQYITQKFQILKNILSNLCENLNTVILKNIFISLFKNNVWGVKKLQNLDLMQQSKVKLLVYKLEKQKYQLISKIQKLSSSQYYAIDSLNSTDFKVLNQALQWIIETIENQFTFIISKVLIKVSEDSKVLLTGKFLDKDNLLKNIKLYLLRYQFINQTLFTNLNLSRIYLLRKQKSTLINRSQYQALKNSWKKFVYYKNSNSIKTVLENKYPILAYLNKELGAKFSYKLSQILEKNALTKTEFYLLSNTVKRLTNVSLAVKDVSHWIFAIQNFNLSNTNQELLTQKIVLNYSVQNIPVYCNLFTESNVNFGTEKADWFKILTNLKFQLNNNKLQSLNSQGWIDANQKNFQLEVKFLINQTFDCISLIEKTWLNGGLAEEQFLDGNSSLKTLKRSSLKYFSKNFKQIIYSSKLNILNERQLITDEQFFEFKQNYENLFQLVQQATNRIALLNARRKWKFINYRKYQTLSQGILKHLSLKITELLAKNKADGQSFKSTISGKENLESLSYSSPKIHYIKNLETGLSSQVTILENQSAGLQIIKNFAQIERQKNNRNDFLKFLNRGQQNISMQDLVQETLGQILDSSETNILHATQRFVEKSSNLAKNAQPISSDLRTSSLIELQNLVILLNVQQIREFVRLTLQRLNSLEKQMKSKGPWLLKDEQNQKYKQIIIQNFVHNVQKLNVNLINISNKSVTEALGKSLLIPLVPSSSAIDFKIETKLNSISVNTDLSRNNNVFLTKFATLQSRLQKQYLKKLNTQLTKKDLRLSILTQKNLLDLSQSQQILTISNILNASTVLSSELNTAILECEFILQNLTNQKIRKKLDLEFKQFSQLSQYQSNNTVLSQKLYNQIRTKIVKLLTDSFTMISSNFGNRNSFFINSNNVEILAKFGLISESMSNQLVHKIKQQLYKQKLQAIVINLGKLQEQFSSFNSVIFKEKKFSHLLQSIHLITVLSQLYELKQTKDISERQYLSVKQKLKQLRLLSLLNNKLGEYKENDKITDLNVIEFRQQIIQKIQQKIKKSKTLSKFQSYLKSLSQCTNLTIKGKKLNSSSQKQIEVIIPNLQTRGRWAQVTLKQLSKQKLITSKQELRLSKLLTQQINLKVEKLRRLYKTLTGFHQLIHSQNLGGFNTVTNEQQIVNIILPLLKSLSGPWKIVMLKQLRKQGFITQHLLENLQQINNNVTKSKQNISFDTISSKNLLFPQTDNFSIEIKLINLLNIYNKQILKLNQLQSNRSIRKVESDRKLKIILSNLILLLENGGLNAFKVIHNTQWVKDLCNFNIKNSGQKRGKFSNGLSPSIIRDFVKKYEIFKTQHLNNSQKLELRSKVNLFNNYKLLILKLWAGLDNKVNDSILNVSRLINLKKSNLITLQQYSNLKISLKTAMQRLTKLDQIFITQNLYLVTRNSNTGTISSLNNSVLSEQYSQLQNKIFQSYLKLEYKQVEKNMIKQKFAQQQLNSYNLNQKATKLLKARLRKKQSIKKEQFAGYFQQLVSLLDSRYKAEGRNRRGPRINSIYRQLNQKLAFDPTLTKKFGVQLQTYIDKRFGPSLPIPPHLELKRWKIKNSELTQQSVVKTTEFSSRQGNQKYLILPVGIVRDMAPRRSVGLPILERLIVEYYSRN